MTTDRQRADPVPVMAAAEVWCRVTVVGPAGTELATWVLSGPGAADLAVVDRLARLRLVATRLGGRFVVRALSPALAELLDLVGLRREVGGKPEGGEQPIGVEEGVEPVDPPG